MREDALEWQALSSIAGESLEPLRVGSEEVQCKSTAREEWGASAVFAGEEGSEEGRSKGLLSQDCQQLGLGEGEAGHCSHQGKGLQSSATRQKRLHSWLVSLLIDSLDNCKF